MTDNGVGALAQRLRAVNAGYEDDAWERDAATILANDSQYLTPAEAERARAIEDYALEVVRLGNQPGMDDDEWEAAFTHLEGALRLALGEGETS